MNSSARRVAAVIAVVAVATVHSGVAARAQCSCSRDGVEAMLRSFSQDDRDHMVENGKISVTCEFCSANYQFEPDSVRPEAGGESGEAKPET